jgi:hypothetical protein
LWYLQKGVTLTKDNLARRNWNGDTNCCFYYSPKTIQHFFCCIYAKFLWRAVHILSGISPPRDIDDLFNSWSKLGGNKRNLLLLTAATALCWAVWLLRNEVVFDKCRPEFFLQVLFRKTHWLRQWARLQRHDHSRDQLLLVGRHLETSALYFFGSNSWLSSRFIGLV